MNLTQEIKKRLQMVNHEALVRKLGYRNTDAGLRTVEAFMKSENIYTWLKNGHFDLYFGAESFLRSLCSELHIPYALCEKEITAAQKRLDVYSRMKEPYIAVLTNFKRTGESITTLVATGSHRRINLPKEVFVDKNRSQALAYMKEIAKTHYSEHNGTLPVWGEITGYVLHLPDGTEVRWSENISI